MESNEYFERGRKAAKEGGWCAAPDDLTDFFTQKKLWYRGFHSAVAEGLHPNLDRNGSLRPGKTMARAVS